MGQQIAIQDTLYSLNCCNCGMTFAVPNDFNNRRLADHGRFYCPAGHGQSYTGKTEEQKLRDRLVAAERERDEARRRTEFERNGAITARREATKAKNKLKAVTP